MGSDGCDDSKSCLCGSLLCNNTDSAAKTKSRGYFAQIFILATLLVTLVGIHDEKSDAIVGPWILTAPVVAYALCNSRVAAKWTVFTLICLIILRPYPVSSVATATTLFLALAVISVSIVLHLFPAISKETKV